jgi:hypothetical protein
MTANTPNRAYTYPQSSDHVRIYDHMQELATDVDTDVAALIAPAVVSQLTNTGTVGATNTAGGFACSDARAATLLAGKLINVDLYLTTPVLAAGNITPDITAFTLAAAYWPSHAVEVCFDQGTTGAFGVINTDGTVVVRSTTTAWAAGNNMRMSATYIKG